MGDIAASAVLQERFPLLGREIRVFLQEPQELRPFLPIPRSFQAVVPVSEVPHKSALELLMPRIGRRLALVARRFLFVLSFCLCTCTC
jgi:hypothetical protein